MLSEYLLLPIPKYCAYSFTVFNTTVYVLNISYACGGCAAAETV